MVEAYYFDEDKNNRPYDIIHKWCQLHHGQTGSSFSQCAETSLIQANSPRLNIISNRASKSCQQLKESQTRREMKKRGASQAVASYKEHLNVLKFKPLYIYLTLCPEL